MKLAISRLTSEIAVIGSKDSMNIGPGAQVDLDRVVGEVAAQPFTVADALGEELLASFEIVAPAVDPVAAEEE